MKKLIVLFVILTLFMVSCTKDEAEKLECESNDVAYITITNTSDNPYNVYVDGEYVFQLQGNTFKDDYAVESGTHVFKAVQQSGYLIYATEVEQEFSVSHCDKRSWVFP